MQDVFLVAFGFLGGALSMLLVTQLVFEPRFARMGYVAGYGDAIYDAIEDEPEVEAGPAPPWRDQRWYPKARRKVLEWWEVDDERN